MDKTIEEKWKKKAFSEAIKRYDIPTKDYRYLFVHECNKTNTINLVSICGDVLYQEKNERSK